MATSYQILELPIKEVISKFPKVADILNDYNIGCVPCSVGTCLLKDIVEIHNLSPEEEDGLLRRIAEVVSPGRRIELPKTERKAKARAKELTYSPPIKRLVDEHTLIKKWVAFIPEVLENLDIKSEEGRDIVLKGINFIRSYADRYHHAKEEEILFKYFDENLDIIKAMLEDHENARAHVRAILDAVEKRDADSVTEHLSGYRELLAEHIKKEDEILYPWIDRNLSTKQIGELFSKFSEVENAADKEVIENSKKFVVELEEGLTKIKGGSKNA